ncbi:hypothetical protein FRC07_010396, partial [Ceratobasidium sp. 392]
WNQLKPKIVEFLETEARDREERERIQHESTRGAKLRELFASVQYSMNTLPKLPGHLSAAQAAVLLAKRLPPPEYGDAVKWPIIRDLLKMDRPVEEMTARFEEQRHDIMKLIEDWERRVKREWADILREGRQEDGLVADPPRPHLYASEAEADPFEDMDGDTCLLLRADSIFEFKFRHQGPAPSIRTYHSLALSLIPGSWPYAARNDSVLDLADYSWYSGAASAARALLRAMGRPDASTVEFNAAIPEYY